jgi:hypothetical protein
MNYVMDLNQFLFLCDQASKHSEITAFDKASATDGVIDTKDAKFAYHYDGFALTYNPIQKHTLAAKMASDVSMERHVNEILGEILQTKNQQDIEVANANQVEPPTAAKTVNFKPIVHNESQESV